MQRYRLANDFKLGVELVCHLTKCSPTIGIIIADTLFHIVNTRADSPPCVSSVHVINEHLKMLFWFGCQREFQSPVRQALLFVGIQASEFPYLGFCLFADKCYRVLKVSGMVHL